MTREEAIECLNYQNEKFFGGQSEALDMAISALSENKGFDGMTNGEVIQALFPNIKLIEKVYTIRKYALMDKSVKALLFLKTTDRWWNAPYQKGGEE